MFVPGLSVADTLVPRQPVPEPKGGGGGGRGSSAKGGGAKSSSSTSSSRGTRVTTPGSTVGRKSAVSYGSGSTTVLIIPAGQPFAGRQSGGATRNYVYGSWWYGSGYPGVSRRGVQKRDFPFVFWPIVWGPSGYGDPYLYDESEYGLPSNTSRPGGPLAQAVFRSTTMNTTFHVISDNSTVTALIASIHNNCTVAWDSSNTTSPFFGNGTDPRPEQAVQYYRASSVVLTLDGYNNTVALTGDVNATKVALPTNINTTLLTCLNETIGEAVPLFDAASGLQVPYFTLLVLLCATLCWHKWMF